MNKTIYIRDEDAGIWERARELAGEKLSPVIVAALKQFIAQQEAEKKGFERLVVKFKDSQDRSLPKAKAFYGRWIYPPDMPLDLNDLFVANPRAQVAVAITAKGSAVFLRWELTIGILCEKQNERFDVFPSLEDAAMQGDFNLPARMALERLGVSVEELDI